MKPGTNQGAILGAGVKMKVKKLLPLSYIQKILNLGQVDLGNLMKLIQVVIP